jgi:hypothetical protein
LNLPPRQRLLKSATAAAEAEAKRIIAQQKAAKLRAEAERRAQELAKQQALEAAKEAARTGEPPRQQRNTLSIGGFFSSSIPEEPPAERGSSQAHPLANMASLLTRVTSALTALEENKLQQHVESENLADTISSWLTEAKAIKNESVRRMTTESIMSIMNAMKLEFKPVLPFDDLIRPDSSADAHSVISKIVARIPRFSGTDSRYNWDSFYTTFTMTVQNASYNKAELRAIFLQCLEGLAFEHYKAHKETYQRMDYKELIQKYAERFGPKRRTGITEIVGITQSPTKMSWHTEIDCS